jgi:hypothetical protein
MIVSASCRVCTSSSGQGACRDEIEGDLHPALPEEHVAAAWLSRDEFL